MASRPGWHHARMAKVLDLTEIRRSCAHCSLQQLCLPAGIGHEDYPAINLWQRQVRKLPGFIGMPGVPDYF